MNNCETPVTSNSCQKNSKPPIKLKACDAIFTIISLGIYTVDVTTGWSTNSNTFSLNFHSIQNYINFSTSLDITLGYQYIKYGHFYWGIMTIVLCFMPTIITQIISMCWHCGDLTLIPTSTILLHFSLLEMVHR